MPLDGQHGSYECGRPLAPVRWRPPMGENDTVLVALGDRDRVRSGDGELGGARAEVDIGWVEQGHVEIDILAVAVERERLRIARGDEREARLRGSTCTFAVFVRSGVAVVLLRRGFYRGMTRSHVLPDVQSTVMLERIRRMIWAGRIPDAAYRCRIPGRHAGRTLPFTASIIGQLRRPGTIHDRPLQTAYRCRLHGSPLRRMSRP